MERVLLVSGTADGKEILSQLIKEAGYISLTAAQSGSEARRLISSCEYDLIVINTPLNYEFGGELAIDAAETTNSGILLICRDDMSDELSEKLGSSGIMVISKPINKSTFFRSVSFVMALRRRILGITKNEKLQTKAEEIKLVNRAKSCLMQYLKFSEPQAHRYIEKQAMDTRRTRKDVAKHILSIYEN